MELSERERESIRKSKEIILDIDDRKHIESIYETNYGPIKRELSQWDDTNVREYRKMVNKASEKQVAGNHYKKFNIQPAEFCHKNNIPYLEATAIKYLCRWRDKGGFEDLDKAIHFIELLKEFESDANT
jgi:hypothetical protein